MKVKKGQEIHFKIPEASSDTFEAEVHLVGTSMGEGRTIIVHGHLKGEEKNNFLTGMFVEADIVTDNILLKSLPGESIVNIDDNDYVLLLDNEEDGNYFLKQVKVSLKGNHEGYVVIANFKAFHETDRFLTKGAFGLLGE